MLKVLFLFCYLILFFQKVVFAVDCKDQECLRELYSAKVRTVKYYEGPMVSSLPEAALIGRRKKRHTYQYRHAGVVVVIDRIVKTQNEWLIHKGNNYGDKNDSFITDTGHMGRANGWRWTAVRELPYWICNITVHDLLVAAKITTPDNLIGPSCQTAANGNSGGGHYTETGRATDLVCLPQEAYIGSAINSGYAATFYGMEYADNFGSLYDEDVPCAVCKANHVTSKVIIPGNITCHAEWRK